jgi:hypothetical protein
VEKPEEKRALRRSGRKWVDNIKMDVRKIWCGVMNFIQLAQGKYQWWVLVNMTIRLGVRNMLVAQLEASQQIFCSIKVILY